MATAPSDADLLHRAKLSDIKEMVLKERQIHLEQQQQQQIATFRLKEDQHLLDVKNKQDQLKQERIDLDIKHQQQIDAIKLKEEALKIKESQQLADLKSKADLFEIDMKRREDELAKGVEKQQKELEIQRQELIKMIQAQQDSFHLLPNANNDHFVQIMGIGLGPSSSSFHPPIIHPNSQQQSQHMKDGNNNDQTD